MDATSILAALLIITWLAGGVAVALIMRRSGHDLRLWLPLGLMLGPFAGVFALERHRLDENHRPSGSGKTHPGAFDAVAGIDGSQESIAAVISALGLFGDRLNSLTLVTVLDHESRASFTGIIPQSEAYAKLADIAVALGYEPVDLVLLFGAPGKEIARFATEHGFELIIVGARGLGMSKSLFGSVTEKLTGGTSVPVFVGPHISRSVPDSSTLANHSQFPERQR